MSIQAALKEVPEKFLFEDCCPFWWSEDNKAWVFGVCAAVLQDILPSLKQTPGVAWKIPCQQEQSWKHDKRVQFYRGEASASQKVIQWEDTNTCNIMQPKLERSKPNNSCSRSFLYLSLLRVPGPIVNFPTIVSIVVLTVEWWSQDDFQIPSIWVDLSLIFAAIQWAFDSWWIQQLLSKYEEWFLIKWATQCRRCLYLFASIAFYRSVVIILVWHGSFFAYKAKRQVTFKARWPGDVCGCQMWYRNLKEQNPLRFSSPWTLAMLAELRLQTTWTRFSNLWRWWPQIWKWSSMLGRFFL